MCFKCFHCLRNFLPLLTWLLTHFICVAIHGLLSFFPQNPLLDIDNTPYSVLVADFKHKCSPLTPNPGGGRQPTPSSSPSKQAWHSARVARAREQMNAQRNASLARKSAAGSSSNEQSSTSTSPSPQLSCHLCSHSSFPVLQTVCPYHSLPAKGWVKHCYIFLSLIGLQGCRKDRIFCANKQIVMILFLFHSASAVIY